MEEYQKRVIEERGELNEKLAKLEGFLYSEGEDLVIPEVEIDRLRRQEMIMRLYDHVLTERIEAFDCKEGVGEPA